MQQFQHYGAVVLNELLQSSRCDIHGGEGLSKRQKCARFNKIYYSDYLFDEVLVTCFGPLYEEFKKVFPKQQNWSFDMFFSALNSDRLLDNSSGVSLEAWKTKHLSNAKNVKKWTNPVSLKLWELRGGTCVFAFPHVSNFAPPTVYVGTIWLKPHESSPYLRLRIERNFGSTGSFSTFIRTVPEWYNHLLKVTKGKKESDRMRHCLNVLKEMMVWEANGCQPFRRSKRIQAQNRRNPQKKKKKFKIKEKPPELRCRFANQQGKVHPYFIHSSKMNLDENDVPTHFSLKLVSQCINFREATLVEKAKKLELIVKGAISNGVHFEEEVRHAPPFCFLCQRLHALSQGNFAGKRLEHSQKWRPLDWTYHFPDEHQQLLQNTLLPLEKSGIKVSPARNSSECIEFHFVLKRRNDEKLNPSVDTKSNSLNSVAKVPQHQKVMEDEGFPVVSRTLWRVPHEDLPKTPSGGWKDNAKAHFKLCSAGNFR